MIQRGTMQGAARAAVAMACLLAVAGCSDDDIGSSGPTPTTGTQATATRTRTTAPAGTATASANTPTPSASPTPTEGTSARAGAYSSTIDLGGNQEAHLNLTVAEDDSATGTLELVETTAGLVRHSLGSVTSNLSISTGLVSLSGSIDPADGTFHFSGNVTGPEGPIPFDLSGTLPSSPSGSGSVTLTVAGQSYTSAIAAGAGPTPLPTSAGGPTPTPVAGGCDHGVFTASFSNVSNSNLLATGPETIGKSNAVDAADGLGTYVWAITGGQCDLELGDVAHGIVIQGVGLSTRIAAGTYTLNSATPPFLGISYSEILYNPLSPAGNFLHAWASTGGTLTITDIGGGAFHFHGTAPMAENPLLHGGTGTFDLEIDGTIDQVNG